MDGPRREIQESAMRFPRSEKTQRARFSVMLLFCFVKPSLRAPDHHPRKLSGHLQSPLMSPEERARRIKVLLFDVDGVLTDGKIWLFPAPAGAELKTQQQAQPKADAGGYAIVSERMMESKGFHAHDGV